MTPQERLESVFGSPEPAQALRSLVQELTQEGSSTAEILSLLEKLLLQRRSREDYQEADEDAVLDVLDAMTGWCHPDARLLPSKYPVGEGKDGEKSITQ